MLNEEQYSKKTYYKYGKNLIHLFRPFTLILLLSVSILVMAASIIYNHIEISLNLLIPIIGAGLSLILINAGSNIINQASDYKSDSISKPYRPIPRGKIKPVDAHSLSFIIFLIALLLALRINTLFGIFIFTIAFFSVTYSLPPRIKKYLLIN